GEEVTREAARARSGPFSGGSHGPKDRSLRPDLASAVPTISAASGEAFACDDSLRGAARISSHQGGTALVWLYGRADRLLDRVHIAGPTPPLQPEPAQGQQREHANQQLERDAGARGRRVQAGGYGIYDEDRR